MAGPKENAASAVASAQTRLDEALAEIEKLSGLDTDSVAFAAHAMKNYLSVAMGTIELVLMRLPEHSDIQLKIWLQGTRHAGDLIAGLVDQLANSDVAKPPTFHFESFDLPILVQRACSFYQRIADHKSIRLDVEPTADVPATWADRVAVAAVLDNLLSNAIKYSPPKSAIQIQVRDEGDWVVCSVRDQGPGLSPEDQARLFQRGAKLAPRPTGGEGSTGYGLAVAKELMERLSGRIDCESAVGAGSCFSFRLPKDPST